MNDYEEALRRWTDGKPADAGADADFPSRAEAVALAEALARVKDWVKARFSLGDDEAVSVAEVACNLPGCPPLETAVSFWTKAAAGDVRHHFKMFKRVGEVAFDDLPYAWMKESLAVPEGFDCECC